MTTTNNPSDISIHAPVKGATVGHARLPAEGGISIHAPVKGATQLGVRPGRAGRISIHAPVKGATRHHSPGGHNKQKFQSTLP